MRSSALVTYASFAIGEWQTLTNNHLADMGYSCNQIAVKSCRESIKGADQKTKRNNCPRNLIVLFYYTVP